MEFLFYSPLEQFEFSVIGGFVHEKNICELLSPLNNNNSDLAIALGKSQYREKVEAEIDQYFNFIMGFSEPRLFLNPFMRETLRE